MNDVKTTFYKTLNIIVGTNRVDDEEAYIINDYISRLEATIKDEQQEIGRLNNIIGKAIEYIEYVKDFNKEYEKEWEFDIFIPHLLDILKGSDKDEINR